MGDSINIRELYMILQRRWMLITTITCLLVIAGAGITFFLLTPKYEATTQILVNQKNASNQLDTLQMRGNIELISTYSDIIKSPLILEKVITDLNLKLQVNELYENITVRNQAESQVFTLTATDHTPNGAVEIANKISAIFQKEIRGIMNVDNVNILAKAELEMEPIPTSPKPLINLVISVVIGFMFGVGVAFLLEYLDTTLKNSDDVAKILELPVLGSVQKNTKHKTKKNHAVQQMGVDVIESQIEG